MALRRFHRVGNGALLCRRHHTFVHKERWTITIEDGKSVTRRSDGSHYEITPWHRGGQAWRVGPCEPGNVRRVEDGLFIDVDGRPGCWWAGADPAYRRYHDEEWGRPVPDDLALFEKLCLEGFQAGLSWLTILRKREYFREPSPASTPRASPVRPADVERLLADPGIVRNRAQDRGHHQQRRSGPRADEPSGSLAGYVWRFEPPPPTARPA